jgi:hypothetical protein
MLHGVSKYVSNPQHNIVHTLKCKKKKKKDKILKYYVDSMILFFTMIFSGYEKEMRDN